MGKTWSKSSQNSGDPQVNIQNSLNVHEEWHEDHDFKLTVILCVVCAQLALALIHLYKQHTRAQAIKVAKSVATLQNV